MATRNDVDQNGIPKDKKSTPTPDAGPAYTDGTKHLGVFCWGTNRQILALMDFLQGIYSSCDSVSILPVPDDERAWKCADGFSSVVIICPSQTFEAPEDSLRRFLDSCFTTHGPENMMVVITDLEDTESEKRRIAEWKEGEYPRCPLVTLTEAEMDVIITSDTADVSAERRMAKKVNRIREILGFCAGSSGNALQQREKQTNKAIIGIFSREAQSQYFWLMELLQSDVFMDDDAEVWQCPISNSGWQQFLQDASRCTFGLLYHTKNGGRINVTDVMDSQYEEELKHLSSGPGKKKVIVVIDDVSDSSDQQKTNILRNQPSINNMADDLFLISAEEKTSSYQRRLMVDREQVRKKLQMVIEKMRKRKNGLKDQSMVTFDLKQFSDLLKTPTSTKPSVVLKHPNFSCVTATGEQDTSINGKVILYFRVVCPEKEDHMEYRIHLYLLHPDIPHLKDLDDLKRDHGFNRIDKPSQTTGSVYTETDYMINLIGEELNPDIQPKVLQFMLHKEINDHPFSEINIPKSANQISLQVMAEDHSELEPVWECRLSRADIEEASGQAVQRGIPPEHFVDKHRVQLIQNVRYIKPVLDDLKQEKLLEEEQCNIITSQKTPEDRMRELLDSVRSWGPKETDTFYKIVKNHNGPIIKEMERKN